MVARAEVEPGTYRKISGNDAIALGLIAGRKKPAATCSSPATRSPRRPRSSKRSPVSNTSASRPCRPRTKSPPSAWPRRQLRRPDRRHRHQRPRHVPQERVHRPGDLHRTAAGHRQRPARRSQHRPADQDRAVRPAAGALRPPRREPAAGGRRELAVRLLPRAFEAVRIALEYSTPVILLSDGYLANGSEPWKIPDEASLPEIQTLRRSLQALRHLRPRPGNPRPHPGDPRPARLEHRIGGLEKNEKGSISYDSDNHAK
jgi:hypothetical protein